MANLVLQRNSSVANAEIDGDVVLMYPGSSKYYCLTGIARQIWDLLAEPSTLESICLTLKQEYQVDSEVCSRDVSHFVEKMQARSLIHAVESK